MNFKAAIKRPFSDSEVLSLLRIFSGVALLSYNLFALLPDWASFFSVDGFVRPETFALFPKSWLFLFWSNDFLKIILFALTLILSVTYTIGIYAKWSLLLLLPLRIGFHLACPFIIHEPQPILNLLLVVLLLLPIDEHWALKKNTDFSKPLKTTHLRIIFLSMILYIGLYYLFAGLKKLPDMHWLTGKAVGLILSWPFLGLDNIFSDLAKSPVVSFVLSYATLFFELGFVFFALTRWRRLLIPAGILFHLGILLTMDIDSFFLPMAAWYPLLLCSDLFKSRQHQSA